MSTIHWTEDHTHQSALWHSENAAPLPRRTVVADDRMRTDDAHYGVFVPVRGEYVDLVARTSLPPATRRNLATSTAFDRGTGTGVLAAVLGCQARRGHRHRPTRPCLRRPWLPARPTGPVEQGVYDPDSAMLHSFLDGLSAHLRPGGNGWLALSDPAEHLGFRTRQQLLDALQAAQLRVVDKRINNPGARHRCSPGI